MDSVRGQLAQGSRSYPMSDDKVCKEWRCMSIGVFGFICLRYPRSSV
jgi:hypothetical protein